MSDDTQKKKLNARLRIMCNKKKEGLGECQRERDAATSLVTQMAKVFMPQEWELVVEKTGKQEGYFYKNLYKALEEAVQEKIGSSPEELQENMKLEKVLEVADQQATMTEHDGIVEFSSYLRIFAAAGYSPEIVMKLALVACNKDYAVVHLNLDK